MAKLHHPHILRCYGGTLEGSNPFIVTELCECSLDKVRADSTTASASRKVISVLLSLQLSTRSHCKLL
jgi:hypothetical protein